jgi:hypothetical protein
LEDERTLFMGKELANAYNQYFGEHFRLRVIFTTIVIVLVVMALPLQSFPAGPESVTPQQEWSGSREDISLLNAAPEFIFSAKEFKNLWSTWKLEGPPPDVDFSDYLVAVQTTQGSRLRLSASLDDSGNLTVAGLATMDLQPGFRYVISVLSRKGVKTVNGRQLPQTSGQKYREAGSETAIADFGVPAEIETRSVKTLETGIFNEEIGQAFRKGEGWPKEAVLIALRFVGAGLKGNTKSIDVRTPPETQDTATVTITESGYLDDAVAGERWRLWLTKKADGTWMINRALWAQLCDRPGRRFYSADRCP